MKFMIQSYFHEKAPFGVVWCRELSEENEHVSSDGTITLIEAGKDAKSKLPDQR